MAVDSNISGLGACMARARTHTRCTQMGGAKWHPLIGAWCREERKCRDFLPLSHSYSVVLVFFMYTSGKL